MSEAVDELVKCLTHADFQSKMVVILAGYESDIDDMLAVNQVCKCVSCVECG